MGPPRQSRQPLNEAPTHPPNSTSSGRHIQTKEKDILHKTLGTTGVSKSKKTPTTTTTPLKASTPSSQPSSNLHNDIRSTVPSITHNSRPIWTTESGSSEQWIKWSTLPLSILNTWRLYYKLPMSASFSSESAQISLCDPDNLGSRSATMRGPPSRQPSARREVERAIIETFEEAVIDEDEVTANFLARREDRKGLEKIGTVPEGGGGNVFGTGRRNARPVRCRSDMLS